MYVANQTLDERNHCDKAGIGASFLCVSHCLLAPLFVTALPAIAATESQTHSMFAVIILLLGMLAFIPGYRKHKKKSIPLIGITGVFMIIIAAILPEMEHAEVLETGLVVVGGITLIFAHLRNAFWCRFCRQCRDHTHDDFSVKQQGC